MAKHIIFGSAGTGKTTRLVKIMEELLNKGVHPIEICFCTFTRSAANEAKERVMSRFNLDKNDLPYFGTIHSLCYKRFCMNSKIISQTQKLNFLKKYGIQYVPTQTDEEALTNEGTAISVGNLLFNFYDKIRLISCKNIFDIKDLDELKIVFYEVKMDEEGFLKVFHSSFNPYELFVDYENYKKTNELLDFSDLLLIALKEQYVVPTQILFVDEFQDLSPLQHAIYRLWKQGKNEVYIAGDDFQTIYHFAGADANFLLNERKSLDKQNGDEEIILPKNYRTKKIIHNYCHNYVHQHIRKCNRVEKNVEAINDGGEIIEEFIYGKIEKVLDFIRPDKSTFVLFRTNYYKKIFIDEVLIPYGVIYHEIRGQSIWNDRTINLFNACVKLVNRGKLNPFEVEYLIQNIPSSEGLLKRGLKTHWKKMDKLESYGLADLLAIGFNFKLFDLLEYEKLYSLLDLGDSLKTAFKHREKKIITYPIKLKIGTIHASKGREADDVIIFKDVSNKVAKEAQQNQKNWENEIRVFYTGQTRAKDKLIILRGGFKYSDPDLIP